MNALSENFFWVIDADVLEVRGDDRVTLLHRLSTNDLRPLNEVGQTLRTIFTNQQGKIVDWVQLYSLSDHLLVRTSAGRAKRLKEWIETYTIMEDVACHDKSSEWKYIRLAGAPSLSKEKEVLPSSGQWKDLGDALLSQDLDVYEDAHTLLLSGPSLEAWSKKLQSQGWVSAAVANLEERRLLAGVPSPDFEFKEEVNPLELKLVMDVDFDKGCYIGQEVIARMDSYQKVARYLTGFEADSIASAKPGDRLEIDGVFVGRVTSVQSTSESTIGLGLIKDKNVNERAGLLQTNQGPVEVRFMERPFGQKAQGCS